MSDEVEAVGAVEGPDYVEMREPLDIEQAGFKFTQNLKRAFCIVLCAKAAGNRGRFVVRAFYESNWAKSKHCLWRLRL